jgi:hypothetical protein
MEGFAGLATLKSSLYTLMKTVRHNAGLVKRLIWTLKQGRAGIGGARRLMKRIAREDASLYLQLKWVFMPMQRDYLAVAATGERLRDMRKDKPRARKSISINGTQGTIVMHLNMWHEKFTTPPHVFSDIYDYIPYSFVLDWVSNVGDYIKSIDNHTSALFMPILSHTIGVFYDVSVEIPESEFGVWTGSGDISHYLRVPIGGTPEIGTLEESGDVIPIDTGVAFVLCKLKSPKNVRV